MRWAVLLVTIAGCGRISFDAMTDGGTADVAVDSDRNINCPPPEICREDSGTTEQLLGVWARNVDDVWAVGANGTALHRTSGTWRVVATGTTDTLSAVWAAPEVDRAYAVGVNSRRIRFDGGTLAETTSGGNQLNGVWGFDNSRVYAVGSAGAAAFFNGSAWSPIVGLPGADLTDVWGSAPDDVWVGTTTFDLQQSTGGSPWVIRDPPPNSDTWVTGWSVSPSEIWAAGLTVQRSDGMDNWTAITVDPTFASPFEAIWGFSGLMWFVGAEGIGVASGAMITPVLVPVEPLHDVHGAGNVVWFVGENGAIYVHQITF